MHTHIGIHEGQDILQKTKYLPFFSKTKKITKCSNFCSTLVTLNTNCQPDDIRGHHESMTA